MTKALLVLLFAGSCTMTVVCLYLSAYTCDVVDAAQYMMAGLAYGVLAVASLCGLLCMLEED